MMASAYAQLGGMPIGRDANDDDHRAETGEVQQVGAVSNRGRRRHDASADKVYAPIGERIEHSLACEGGLSVDSRRETGCRPSQMTGGQRGGGC